MSYSWKAPAEPGGQWGLKACQRQSDLTFELLVQPASARYAEGTDEFFKVYMAVLVLVEDVEDIVCEFAWVAEREELLVYPTELGLIELS